MVSTALLTLTVGRELIRPLWSTTVPPGSGVVGVARSAEAVAVQPPTGVPVMIRQGQGGHAVKVDALESARLLALSERNDRLVLMKGQKIVLCTEDGKQIGSFTVPNSQGSPYLARFSPDGTSFAVASGTLYHNWVDLIDTKAGKRIRQILTDVDGRAQDIVYDGSGTFLAVDLRPRASKVFGGSAGVTVFRTHTGQPIAHYVSVPEYPEAFGFSRTGDRLFVKEPSVQSFISVRPVPVIERPFRALSTVLVQRRPRGDYKFLPGTHRIAFAAYDEIWIESKPGEEPVRLAAGMGGKITSFRFSPSGDRVALVRETGVLEIWKVPATLTQ